MGVISINNGYAMLEACPRLALTSANKLRDGSNGSRLRATGRGARRLSWARACGSTPLCESASLMLYQLLSSPWP